MGGGRRGLVDERWASDAEGLLSWRGLDCCDPCKCSVAMVTGSIDCCDPCKCGLAEPQ